MEEQKEKELKKQQKKEYNKMYYQRNQDKIKETNNATAKSNYYENIQAKREYQRAYYQKNIENLRLSQKILMRERNRIKKENKNTECVNT